MRTTIGLAMLTSSALGRTSPEPLSFEARAVAFVDAETGFTFSETKAAATLSSNIIYRIATPANVPPYQPYEIVLQVIAPFALGWVGLAWGGGMVDNPLTVSYPHGQKPAVSSRWATSHSPPQAYTGAIYTPLQAGNKANGTHWQYTVRCQGCTSYTGSSGPIWIDPTSSTRFGYAAAAAKVSNPNSNTSAISVHDVYNYIIHDFSAGANSNFTALLEKNGIASSKAKTETTTSKAGTTTSKAGTTTSKAKTETTTSKAKTETTTTKAKAGTTTSKAKTGTTKKV